MYNPIITALIICIVVAILSEIYCKVKYADNIDEFDINNGKLIYTKSKSKAPLSKKHLLNSLNDFYKNDVEMADQLTKFIMDSRLEVTKEQIKHKD